MGQLLLNETIRRREEYSKEWKAYIHQNKECGNLDYLLQCNDITLPHKDIGNLEQYVDTIAGGMSYKNRVCCIFGLDKVKVGIGKTWIWTTITGVKLAYEKIPSEKAGLSELKHLDVTSARTGAKLIFSDMVYCGENGGKLVIAPPVGEKLIAMWDIARNIYRAKHTDLDWQSQKTPGGREIRKALFIKFPFLSIAEIFEESEHLFYPDLLFGVILNEPKNKPRVEIEEFKMEKEATRALMESPLYYNEDSFWKRNLDEHSRRMDCIISKIDKFPKAFKILITPAKEYPAKEVSAAIIGIIEHQRGV